MNAVRAVKGREGLDVSRGKGKGHERLNKSGFFSVRPRLQSEQRRKNRLLNSVNQIVTHSLTYYLRRRAADEEPLSPAPCHADANGGRLSASYDVYQKRWRPKACAEEPCPYARYGNGYRNPSI
jgi:hypothetical protein